MSFFSSFLSAALPTVHAEEPQETAIEVSESAVAADSSKDDEAEAAPVEEEEEEEPEPEDVSFITAGPTQDCWASAVGTWVRMLHWMW